MIAKEISHYQIFEKLGEGGNGIVYKAEDTKLKRTVALKFLSKFFSEDEESKRRFISEAQKASSLDHPNIYTIHEIGQTDEENLFISMTYYEGENLRDRIKSKEIKKEEAAEIAIQICEGLNKAHQNNIVHRDIKPANIFLTKDGIVKILDFGLAKEKGQCHLTKEGTTLGTVAYMSPEQARGEDVDQRTDIWSLGIVIYEMLTGKPPFDADYDQATIYSILNTKPELNKLPKEFVPILKKALAKPVNERYQNIEELLADLNLLRKGFPVKHDFSIPFLLKSFKVKLAAAAIIIILLAVISFLFIKRPVVEHSTIEQKKIVVVLPFENLGSPDDKYFAEGIAQEITSKLASIREINVISSKSAKRFFDLKMSTMEISSELGANYILEGTVAWAKTNGKKSTVKIIPELIRVSDNTIVWSDSYDKVLDDIFTVQDEIAQNVSEKIDGTLIPAKSSKAESPTGNMGAYTYYLKGLDYENRWYVFKEDFEKRISLFKKAVKLDPKFAQAYAHLSIAESGMYGLYFERKKEMAAEALKSAMKALQLNPNIADVHFALAYYYSRCEQDYNKALKEYSEVLRIKPNDADAYSGSASIYRAKGNFQLAIQNFKKASSLDPLSIMTLFDLGETYRIIRDYKNADKYYKHAVRLKPDLPFTKAQLALNYIDWKGDTKTAEEVIKNSRSVDEDYYNYDYSVSVYIDVLKRDYDGAIRKLMPLNRDTADELMGYTLKKLELGLLYRFKNEPGLSRAYFDSTRIQIEKMYRENPLEKRLHSTLGIVYAGLGNRDKALAECKRSIEMHPVTKDGIQGSEFLASSGSQWDLAQAYILLGDYDKALNQIDFLLSIPGEFSINKLKLDPLYDPLRNLPGYKKIIEKYAGMD